MKLNSSIQTTLAFDSKIVDISKSSHSNEDNSKQGKFISLLWFSFHQYLYNFYIKDTDLNKTTSPDENSNSNSGSDASSSSSGDWAKNAKKSIINSIAKIKLAKPLETLSTITKAKNVTPIYTSLINPEIVKQSLASNLVVSLNKKRNNFIDFLENSSFFLFLNAENDHIV